MHVTVRVYVTPSDPVAPDGIEVVRSCEGDTESIVGATAEAAAEVALAALQAVRARDGVV